jgi:hypothetical protein
MQMNAARGTLIAGLMTSLVALPAWAAAPIVNASIDPARITLGQSARLTLSRLGEDTDPVTLPVVEGLEFRVIEQLRGFEVIHGASMNTTSIVVRVTPQTTGTFIIPGFTPKSQPLVLRVDPDGGPSNASGALSGKMSGSAVRMTADGSAFVRLTVPKDEVYVGESVPIAIEVGVRAGIVTGLNGLPTLTGADFTLNNLSRQPERSERIIDGKPFTLLTWRSVLAAIKPGRFSLEVDTPLTVRVTTRPPRESLLEDQLGDPFMQNFFGATVPKEITVASPTYEVTVLALPAEGRPAAFSGAVGSFAITSDVAPAAAAAGDPLTLRMHVVGSGNFDRVDSRMLEHLDAWKTYPPKYSFKAADALGYKGEKIFEQPVIASKPGAQTLPGLTFSYFDPATRRYETARSAPLAVTIAPSVADAAPPAAPIEADAGASVRPSSAGNQASLKLRPDHPAADAFAVPCRPDIARAGVRRRLSRVAARLLDPARARFGPRAPPLQGGEARARATGGGGPGRRCGAIPGVGARGAADHGGRAAAGNS